MAPSNRLNEPQMNENPIACSLDAANLERRLAEIKVLGHDSLLSHREEGHSYVLHFEGDSRTRKRLEAILAAERECCPFLDLDLRQVGDQLVLSIAAPAEAAAVAAALASQFVSR
jgi:hypothetical protein